MAHPLFEKHQTLLARALDAVRNRTYWSAYSENPKTYGDNAIEEVEHETATVFQCSPQAVPQAHEARVRYVLQ